MTELPINTIICGDWIKVAKGLPDGCVHVIVTSPPYWGQRNYNTGKWEGGDCRCDHAIIQGVVTDKYKLCRCGAKYVDGQLGLEKVCDCGHHGFYPGSDFLPAGCGQCHICKLVEGFRELRRILRDDGQLWVNYGDKYTGGGCTGDPKAVVPRSQGSRTAHCLTMASGNLIGLAWRLALALQASGWVLRSDVIWAKAVSFNDKYSGSTMPESVNGTRWEKCRVKVKAVRERHKGKCAENTDRNDADGGRIGNAPWNEYADCPDCAKCKDTGGYALRRGSWRATRSHEYLFQFVKQVPYYADMEAVREDTQYDPRDEKWDTHRTGRAFTDHKHDMEQGRLNHRTQAEGWVRMSNPSGRNIRDVWTINPQAYPDAHYATFPEKLIEPIIKVATSQKGVCPQCGSQWARVIESRFCKSQETNDAPECRGMNIGVRTDTRERGSNETTTLGWRPTCTCNAGEPVPAVVYDPFMGSGTVAAVAAKLGRNYMGSELSAEYMKQVDARVAEAETGIPKQEARNGQKALFE